MENKHPVQSKPVIKLPERPSEYDRMKKDSESPKVGARVMKIFRSVSASVTLGLLARLENLS